MKAIFVCDNNPAYSGFWEHQAKYMWKRYAIPSLLYYLSDSDTNNLFTSEFAEVRSIRLSTSTPNIIQALFAKWYFPCYENTSEKLLICDIDCFILSKQLIDTIKSVETLFHLKNLPNNSVPGYYLSGYVSQLREFFRVDEYPDFDSFCIARLKELENRPVNADQVSEFSKSATPNWKYFGSEEEYAGRCELQYKKPVRKDMDSPTQYTSRICRSMNSVFNDSKLRSGGYIDYHCPRPYEKYEATIRNILDKTMTL